MSEQQLEVNVQFLTKQMQKAPKTSSKYKLAENNRLYYLKELVKIDEQRMYLTT